MSNCLTSPMYLSNVCAISGVLQYQNGWRMLYNLLLNGFVPLQVFTYWPLSTWLGILSINFITSSALFSCTAIDNLSQRDHESFCQICMWFSCKGYGGSKFSMVSATNTMNNHSSPNIIGSTCYIYKIIPPQSLSYNPVAMIRNRTQNLTQGDQLFWQKGSFSICCLPVVKQDVL